MNTRRRIRVLLCLAVAAALPALAKDEPTVKLGQTSAQIQAILGEPRWSWARGVRKVLSFEKVKVTLVNERVTEIHIWRSCVAQGRAGEVGCRPPEGLVEVLSP